MINGKVTICDNCKRHLRANECTINWINLKEIFIAEIDKFVTDKTANGITKAVFDLDVCSPLCLKQSLVYCADKYIKIRRDYQIRILGNQD